MPDRTRFGLDGRVAMVTGAGQGVGRHLALGFARAGAAGIVVNDIAVDRAEAVAAEVRALGVPAFAMAADVCALDQVRAGVEQATAALGPILVLLNNAGNAGADGFPLDFPLFWDSDPIRWRRFVDVNLYGVMNCCHTVLPGMVAHGYGRVATIVSDAGRTLEARSADYAAAKAGAAGFMRGLAADAARFGTTANSIALATIEVDRPAEPGGAPPASARAEAQLRRYPLGRLGRPDDVVGTALLLCSDAGSWITGQTYVVNGGYSAGL